MRTLVAVALATLVACAGTGPNLSTKEGYRLLAQDKPTEALAEFERLKALAPENKEIRLGVGSAHFALAKQALKEKNEETYIAELARAQDEALRAIELDPEFAGAHNLLGIIAAYRSDLDAAQQSFELARRLEPLDYSYYLNLAEVNVYRGNLVIARRYLLKARERGAPDVLVEYNETLAAWRSGDYVEARDIFDDIVELNPQAAKALIEDLGGSTEEGKPATFEQLAQGCCQQSSCGPFMKSPCTEMKQQVASRIEKEETRKKELEMEADRAQRAAAVNDRLRELQIEVEDLGGGPPPDPSEVKEEEKAEKAAAKKAKPKAKPKTAPKTQPKSKTTPTSPEP
jgi:tetratricopeptide (TPR) repeat protein